MKIHRDAFNLYFLGLALLLPVLLAGCASPEGKRKKELSTLRVHAEASAKPADRRERIQVFRAQPYWLEVEKQPFLTEKFVKQAQVIEVPGGYALRIQFDREGTWLLEEYTAALRSRHLAIFSQFVEPGQEKLNEGRWLGAPLVQQQIADGSLVFTPDASRQEAEEIALGLNHVAKKLETGNEK